MCDAVRENVMEEDSYKDTSALENGANTFHRKPDNPHSL